MNTNFLKTSPISLSWRTVAIALVVLGLVFRFTCLDQKVYWADEAFTSLRIAGYTVGEVAQAVYGKVTTVEAFQKYQHLSPDKTIGDTVKGLITEEPQLTPLYFVIAHAWAQVFGTSITAIRSLSAVFGALAIVCMYFLCLELFRSRLAGWIGAALLAVSPFHVLYAQEARPYSLMTLWVILSSYVFLRTLQHPTKLNRSIYCITIILGLYSHLLTILAVLAHGAYLFFLHRFRKTRCLLNYLLSLTVAFLAFLPWILIIAVNQHQAKAMLSWIGEKKSFFGLIRAWLGNISRLVIDSGFSSSLSVPPSLLFKLLLVFSVLFLLSLTIYSLFYVRSQTAPSIWLFPFSLIGVTFLLLWFPDLWTGGRQSTIARYSIPLFLGIQLAITYLFASKIDKLSAGAKAVSKNKLWCFLIIITFTFSIISCSISRHTQVWWHQSPEYTHHIPKAAFIINHSESPLVVAITNVDTDLMRIQSLAYLLDPNVKLQFFRVDDSSIQAAMIQHNALIYIPFTAPQELIETFNKTLSSNGTRSLVPFDHTDNMLFRLK